jgi:hypothetical protein
MNNQSKSLCDTDTHGYLIIVSCKLQQKKAYIRSLLENWKKKHSSLLFESVNND